MTSLQVIWFILIGVLLTGYAILDGFDLGVGCLFPFLRREDERRLALASISPVWDGNEVWLLAGGGALFAAFPPVYATVMSALYLVFVLFLLALILRAAAIEFRNQVDNPRWRRTWDAAFCLGSAVPALLLGLALGNILRGLPLDSAGNSSARLIDLLHPFAWLTGVLSLCTFAMHGALYLTVKTEGLLAERASRFARRLWPACGVLFAVIGLISAIFQQRLWANVLAFPALLGVPLLTLGCLLVIPRCLKRGEPRKSFLASAGAIVGWMGMLGLALFPNLVPCLDDSPCGLTLANASASEQSLTALLIVALIGMPLVLLYTFVAYRVFRGKARSDDLSY